EEHVLGLAAAAAPPERSAVQARLGRAAARSVPALEIVDGFAERYDRLEAERARIARERARIGDRRRDAERRLDELRRMSDIPTEADLAGSRAERDALWVELQRMFTERPEAVQERAGTYEGAVEKADGVADRLRREADRVAV